MDPAEDFQRRFCARLRQLRLERGLLQDAFEDHGVPHGTYQYIELGRHEPKLSTIVRIAHALGVRPMDLLDVEGVEPLGPLPRGGARKKGKPA